MFFNNNNNKEISIEEARHKQEEFKRYLKKKWKSEINLKNKKEKTLANINNYFNVRNKAIKFVDDYGSMIIEVKRKATEEELKTRKNWTQNSPLEYREESINEIRKDENINEQTFKECFLIILHYY